MEKEVREILRSAINERDEPLGGLGTEIASLFSDTGLDQEIPELQGHFQDLSVPVADPWAS